jgi:anti-sigma factor RsiW
MEVTPVVPPAEGDLPGRRQPKPKLYTEEDLHAKIAEVLRQEQQRATTQQLKSAQAELEARIDKLNHEVRSTLEAMREEVVKQQKEISEKAERARSIIEERSAQFRISELGEFEMGRFPDLWRFLVTNEPILRVMIARSISTAAVEQKEQTDTREFREKLLAYGTVAAGSAGLVAFVTWLLQHLH